LLNTISLVATISGAMMGVRDMFPSSVFPNTVDRVCGYTKRYSYFFRKPCILSDFDYIGICKFGLKITRAIGLPLFLATVIHIILKSSKKKMFRIATGWGVALVKHVHTFWNRTIMDFPRDTMGTNIFSFTIPDLSIPLSICSPYPKPTTTIRFRHDEIFKPVFNLLSGPDTNSVDARSLGLATNCVEGSVKQSDKSFLRTSWIKFIKNVLFFLCPLSPKNSTNPHPYGLSADCVKGSVERGGKPLLRLSRIIPAENFQFSFSPRFHTFSPYPIGLIYTVGKFLRLFCWVSNDADNVCTLTWEAI